VIGVFAVIALGIAVIALLLASAGVVAALSCRKNRRRYESLAEQIDVDARLTYLTTQTLGAMRDVARDQYRRDEPF
jgi:hypothetical protein